MIQQTITYLKSKAHITGSALAAGCAGAHALGFIGPWWLALCAMAYVAGAAAFSFGVNETSALASPPKRSEEWTTSEALDWLRLVAREKLSGELAHDLGGIVEKLHSLAPRLKQMEEAGEVDGANRLEFKMTVRKHLPQALEVYLRLPPDVAKRKAAGGRTPNELLAEQLRLVREHVESLEQSFWSKEVNQMLVNERFINEKLSAGADIFGNR